MGDENFFDKLFPYAGREQLFLTGQFIWFLCLP